MKSLRLAPLQLSFLFFLLLALTGCNTATHKVSSETTTRPSLNAVEIRQLCRNAKAYALQNDHDPKHAVELLDDCLQYPLMNYRRAEYLRERAWQKGLIEDYDGAYTDFAQIEHLVSEKANIIYDIGRTRMRQGDYEGAIKEFRRCIGLEITEKSLPISRGKYRFKMAECLEELGDLQGAINAFSDSIDISPEHRGVAYYSRARLKKKIGDIQGASEDIRKAHIYEPKNGNTYTLRDNIKATADEDWKGSIEDYSNALQLNSKESTAYHRRALHRKFYKDSLKDYNEAIWLNPKNAAAYYERGRVKWKVSEYIEAIDDYTKAIELSSKTPEHYYLTRAGAYQYLEEIDKAQADFSMAIELDPHNTEAYYERGRCKATQRNFREAIKDFSKAISLEPEYSEAYYFRAIAFFQIENFTEAIDDLTKVVQLEPTNVNAYHDRALVNLYMRMKEKALADAFKVLSLYPDYTLFWQLRLLIEENTQSL